MNYKPFYSIIRRYVNNKITRLRFELDWKLEQQEQGLAEASDVSLSQGRLLSKAGNSRKGEP